MHVKLGTISSATKHAHLLSPSCEVEYGLERINHEVSNWMKHANNRWGQPTKIPFIAIRGFDSIVWSRLYSHETFQNPEDKIQVHRLQLWLYIYPSFCVDCFKLLCFAVSALSFLDMLCLRQNSLKFHLYLHVYSYMILGKCPPVFEAIDLNLGTMYCRPVHYCPQHWWQQTCGALWWVTHLKQLVQTGNAYRARLLLSIALDFICRNCRGRNCSEVI